MITGNELFDMAIAITFMAIGIGAMGGLTWKGIKKYRQLKAMEDQNE